MRVVGIHDGHNATACLLENGKIKYVIQEERLTGIKNYSGFPKLALTEILNRANLSIKDIDWIAMNSKHLPYSMNREELIRHFKTFSTFYGKIKRVARATPINFFYRKRRRKLREEELIKFGIPLEKVIFVDHHLAHAAAAYFGSPWRDKVLVLTCDGAGDDICATVNIGQNNKITRIAEIDESHSIGIIYAMVTFLLGMVPNEHEYKLMGMAPYAPKKGVEKSFSVFRRIIEFDDINPLIWKRKKGIPNAYYSFKFLQKSLEFHRFDWICGGLQRWTEEILVRWVRNCIGGLGIRKVSLGGGVFMNVKANKAISEIPEVEKLFIFPSCGDESNAIGAAFWVYSKKQKSVDKDIQPIKDVYWGQDYYSEEIKKILEEERTLKYEYWEDIEKKVAKLLAQGEIVARFKGRMEFGARALGNRSILANPSQKDIIKIINEMIKGRDFWMPFAVSILKEREKDYIKNPKGIEGPYMIMSYDTTNKAKEIQAGIHLYDQTVRPQIVYKEWNPDYYYLIKEFEKITGIGAVLNTSFNLHGYPIVGTPKQAIEVLKRSGLKFLAIENYLVEKK